MRVHVLYFTLLSHLSEHNLNSARMHSVIRPVDAYKESRIPVISGFQVLHQVQFCSCVKIYDSFLVALTKHHALPLFKVYVGDVEVDEFSYAHPGGIQHVNDCKVPEHPAVIP